MHCVYDCNGFRIIARWLCLSLPIICLNEFKCLGRNMNNNQKTVRFINMFSSSFAGFSRSVELPMTRP